MKPPIAFGHRFVEFIPAKLDERVLYISIEYSTAAHLCACGCGNRVVTPLKPTDWSVTFNGEAVSLDPSIGNWSFPCQSHYWLREDRIEWSRRWSTSEIERGRAGDRARKQEQGSETNLQNNSAQSNDRHSESLWSRLKRWFE